MSDNKNAMMGFFPMFPDAKAMPFFPPFPGMDACGWPAKKDFDKDVAKEQWDTFWDQVRDMQKAARESAKKQWKQFFEQCQDMQKNFADAMSDETPFIPGVPSPISPKAFMEKLMEFQKTLNDHANEQEESMFDFFSKVQDQVKDMVNGSTEEEDDEPKKAAPKTRTKK